SLTDYELNPAVVPILLQEQVRRAKENYVPLRIREALWASRLCSTIAALLSDKPESIARAVIYWAGQYAATEGFSFYAGTDFNTSELDKTLLNAPEPIEEALTVVYLPTSVFRHSFRRKKTDVVSNARDALEENSKRGYTK
ncbi:MAG: hypothetical protein V1823_04130, partial [Chloroflexota bacterium]